MKDIFADTSGLANLVDTAEPYHQLAKSIFQDVLQSNGRFVTTNYVLAELIVTLHSPLRIPRTKIVGIVDGLKVSSLFDIIHINQKTDDEAYDLLKNRQDKDWSLVDCSSFVLMTELALSDALTTDHHFEQAGFNRLLK